MTIDEIKTRVATVAGTTPVKLDHMPDFPDACLAVFGTGGFPSDTGFGVDGIQFEHPTVAIWARGLPDDSETPRELLNTVYRNLARVQATTLSGTRYLMARAMQTPFLLERDAKRRCVYVVNFVLDKEPS